MSRHPSQQWKSSKDLSCCHDIRGRLFKVIVLGADVATLEMMSRHHDQELKTAEDVK